MKNNMIDRIEKIKDIKIEDLKPLHHVGGFFGRLVSFLKEYSVIGVAIGMIVAQAAKDFVGAVVSGIFIPALNLLIPDNELATLTFVVRGVRFNLGSVFSTMITLLIIIIFLYLIFKKLIKAEVADSEIKEEDKIE